MKHVERFVHMDVMVRNAEEHEQRWFYGGGLQTWLVHDADTDHRFMLLEAVLEGGKMTPLHIHLESEEIFYLLEGTIVLHVAGTEHELRAGGVSIVPRGVPHAFKVTSSAARILSLHTPGGGEQFCRLGSEPVVEGHAAPGVDLDRIRQAYEECGDTIRLVGPPPF